MWQVHLWLILSVINLRNGMKNTLTKIYNLIEELLIGLDSDFELLSFLLLKELVILDLFDPFRWLVKLNSWWRLFHESFIIHECEKNLVLMLNLLLIQNWIDYLLWHWAQIVCLIHKLLFIIKKIKIFIHLKL